MTAVLKIPARMTIAEFLAWNPPAGRLWQLVDGELQAMAPASRALADPVLLVEILSPSNQAESRANVWAYTTIPSVPDRPAPRNGGAGGVASQPCALSVQV